MLDLIQRHRSCRRGIGWRPHFGDQPQDLGKQHPRHGDLGHLEGDIAAVGHHLRTDLEPDFPPRHRIGIRQRGLILRPREDDQLVWSWARWSLVPPGTREVPPYLLNNGSDRAVVS
jgi:hypothetical protein